ncbi:MAG: ABC transporter substrate-binding protein [Synergistaceae bacterium]|nr:ABC transporter substrate-binding protein [Synergistaceae bacterium]
MWIFVIVTVVTGLVWTGCGEAAAKDSLTIATAIEPPSLSTVDNDSLATIYIHLLTNNLLVKADPETLNVVPDLAESWENPSDTEWLFHLHKGVKFHHGREFTAEDVIASIANAKKYPATIPYTEEIEKVEAVDKYTVKFTLRQPYSNLLYDLAYHFNYILPKDLLESGHDFSSNPVGTGPYKFVEWSKGNHITLEKFDDYWDATEKPSIKTITWRIIPEGTSRTLALEVGEVDAIYHVETADVQRLKSNPEFYVDQLASVENFYLCINTDIAPFDNVDLRNAIHCAIDREALIAGALNGYGVPSYSSIPMGYWGSWDGNAKPYDVALAKELLKKWGGDPTTVILPILVRTDELVRVATIIQDSLAQVGIKVDVVSVETATWHAKRASGDYVSGITSWSPSNAFTYVMRYHSSKRKSVAGACNDQLVDDLIAQMKSELDADKRLDLIHKIVERVNDLAIQPSLWQGEYFRAYNAKLKGIVSSATGYMRFHTARWTD